MKNGTRRAQHAPNLSRTNFGDFIICMYLHGSQTYANQTLTKFRTLNKESNWITVQKIKEDNTSFFPFFLFFFE